MMEENGSDLSRGDEHSNHGDLWAMYHTRAMYHVPRIAILLLLSSTFSFCSIIICLHVLQNKFLTYR